MSDFDINVEKIEFSKNEFSDTKLTLYIHGLDINNFVLTSLRKVCTDQVPVYAFGNNGIKILRNSSVFDNTELKMSLCTLPLPNIKYDVKYIPYKYYDNTDEFPENNTKIEYYVKIKNNEFNTIRDVTTNDLNISVNDEHIENKLIYDPKYPISLFHLRYNDEIELAMKAKLGVGEMHGIYNASHTWFYDLYQEDDKEVLELREMIEKKNKKSKDTKSKKNNSLLDDYANYILIIESAGQLNEFEILKRGIELIIIKLGNIKKDVNESQISNVSTSTDIILDFQNEDFTCIGQLNYFLQDDNDVAKSGASKPNYMEKRINLCFSIKENKNFLDIFNRNIDKTIKFYETLLKKVIHEM